LQPIPIHLAYTLRDQPSLDTVGSRTMAHRRTGGTLAATLVAAALAVPAGASAATITNAGFESGDLTGWTVVDSGSGTWSVYSGPTGPGVGLAIGVPPEGTYGAATSQGNLGTHVLYQDVALEAGYTHTLKLSIYWVNNAAFVTPSPQTLDATGGANQQYRIDVMKPSAAATSVDPADVLASVYQSQAGDPTTQAPREVTADLSALAGQTVRLRIAEADNQDYFSAAVDDVRIASTAIPAPPITTPPVTTPTTPPVTTTPLPAPVVCTSTRRFTIHLRPAAARLTSAVVKVNGKKVRVRTGKRLTAVVDLRGLAKGTYKVTIAARDVAGHVHRETRSYRTC
jgi:hypothetical protein